ncbi:MAG TPA: ribonuclease PH [Polyangiaceae bacterium]|jgi:ribonuclease PH|nr:MAG: Ribonuclease PH [Deltaproteobacteria bacterium ADurb.Bin207]HNS97662.1 ribonuclease PH [Polyangiaceae bacterium]HNZ24822.1 ribonuclease PH [Polyangiaceae bacterium]HOD25261.1 ribonuclease PH [Polyangiaceae bacterium]HOE48005.1 ribonuclease PH [Polyangiaceae bacterium]
MDDNDESVKKDPRKIRTVQIIPHFHRLAEGSVLYKAEGTVVLVTASIDENVPEFMRGRGVGWITAEYQMHPRANPSHREKRDGRGKAISGRTQEIQRLIGRSLRAAIQPDRLGERTITIDCDVLEADGGTRTASITGAWVALVLALSTLHDRGVLTKPVLRDQVAAVSVGHVDGQHVLDLCYAQDSRARVDLNLVATGRGAIVEIQGTAEGEAIPRAQMDALVDLALEGIGMLMDVQREVLEQAGIDLSALMIRDEGV